VDTYKNIIKYYIKIMSVIKVCRKKLFDRLKILGECDDDSKIFMGWKLIECIKVPQVEENIAEDKKKLIEEWNTHNFNNDEDHKYNICLCSKYPLQYLNLLCNYKTNQQCIIGSCCILKFGHENIKSQVNTKLKIIKGSKNGYRYCLLCKRKLLNKTPKWKTYHDKCYLKSRTLIPDSNTIEFLDD